MAVSRMHTDRWIIVGGGASGLAAAYFLRQHGIDSVIVERDGAIGGRMGTVRVGDRVLDAGGKNIGRRYRLFRQFAASLGAHPLEPFGLNSSQIVGGRVRTFDAGARWRTMLALARGVRPADLARFGSVLWHVNADDEAGCLGSPLSAALASRYDRLPASRHFSREFCRRFIRPMSVRMNGAEPDEVYVGNLPSNARMILDTYEQFTNGLAPLLDDFARRYEVRVDTATEGLVVRNGRVSGVRVRHCHGPAFELEGAGVILATPASAAAPLAEPLRPELARELRLLAYHPVALVVAEYDRPIFSPAARAFVFDEGEPVSNAGAYGLKDLHVVRYTISGRAAREHIKRGSDEALLTLGEAALAKHLPVHEAERLHVAVRRFDPGLCAYAPHHSRVMKRIGAALDGTPGLYLTGDYVQGASIEACFRAAAACANQLASREARPARRSA